MIARDFRSGSVWFRVWFRFEADTARFSHGSFGSGVVNIIPRWSTTRVLGQPRFELFGSPTSLFGSDLRRVRVRLGTFRLDSVQLGSTRYISARLSPTRFDSVHFGLTRSTQENVVNSVSRLGQLSQPLRRSTLGIGKVSNEIYLFSLLYSLFIRESSSNQSIKVCLYLYANRARTNRLKYAYFGTFDKILSKYYL
ncbi:hypothetical protein Hanom_Chr16g01441921 [Helianthus anomalus]